MNYFAHARPFLDQPYFMAGTGMPDWLTVVDRRVRLRAKHAEALRHDARPWVAQVAGGVLQPLRDDARMTQIARNLTDVEDEFLKGNRYVLMDRDCPRKARI
jgi:hypothetical protein